MLSRTNWTFQPFFDAEMDESITIGMTLHTIGMTLHESGTAIACLM
jgi:hypothetical protein